MINDVKPRTLLSLLIGNEKQRIFVIPEYQRDYRWRKEEISEFVTDIFEAYQEFQDDKNNKNYNYFFGAIITEKQEELSKEGILEYHLIDGQQRITTSILFIKYLETLFYNVITGNAENYIENYEVDDLKHYFRHAIWVDGDKQNKNCKLISKKFEDSHLLKDILAFDDFKGVDYPHDKNHKFYENYELLKEMYNANLKEKYDNDTHKISDFELNDFIRFVFNNLEFVQVDTDSREAALKIFSVLNTRGLELDATDIIKAEAMAKLSSEDEYRDFLSIWKKLEKKAIPLGVKTLDPIFRYYINMYKPSTIKVTNNKGVEEIWKKFGTKMIEALEDFKKFTESLEYIWAMNDPYIWCLRHLLVMGKNAYTWIPVLVTMKYRGYDDESISNIAKFITKWHWIYFVHGATVEKIKSLNFALIKCINEKNENKTTREIKETEPSIIRDGKSESVLIEEFAEILKTAEIDNTKWIRPLLFFLHEFEILENDKSRIFKKINKDDTLEHIRSKKTLKQGLDTKKRVIGNLSILPRDLNSQASNKGISEKAEIFKKSCFIYKPDLTNKEWSDDEIDKRSNEVIEALCLAIGI